MKKIKALVFLILLALLPESWAAPSPLVKAYGIDGKQVDALPNQVLVKYRRGSMSQARGRIMSTFATRKKKSLDKIETDILTVPAGESIDSFIKQLQSDPDVEFAEPNAVVHALFSPDDPEYVANNQYYLGSTKLNMPQAWDISLGSPTVIVADIDTGALLGQPEISGQFIPGIGTTFGIDWLGDGTSTDTATCAQNCLGNDQTAGDPPMDNNFDRCNKACQDVQPNIYHGTRTSSLIAAQTNNASGMAAVAPNCKLMIVKSLNNKGNGTLDSVASGIIYAVDNGAKVINMSLGSSSSSQALNAAVQYALQHDVVVVAASGNEAPCAVDYPAAISGVIAVGATDSSDGLASFSCTGSNLDLVAPGVLVLSLSSATTTLFDAQNGTSFSSPLVAGVAALVRSIAPALTYVEVTRYIDFFADDLGSAGFDSSYGYGRLDAYRTLVAVSSQAAIPSDSASPGKTYPQPNPYHPTLGLPVYFAIPSALGTVGVEIKIKNVAGETVKTINGPVTNNGVAWDGKNDDGNFVASGLYFYFLKSSAGNITGKLTVIK